MLEGSLDGERRTFRYPTAFANKSKDHGFIPRLWATRRVGFLLDQIRLSGEKDELKDEVVTLARRWGIVTPYTSYLIIEDEESRAVPLARQTVEWSLAWCDGNPRVLWWRGLEGAQRSRYGGIAQERERRFRFAGRCRVGRRRGGCLACEQGTQGCHQGLQRQQKALRTTGRSR